MSNFVDHANVVETQRQAAHARHDCGDLFDRRLALAPRRLVHLDDDPPAIAGQREDDGEIAVLEKDRAALARRNVAVELGVGECERFVVRKPGKRHAERVAHEAMRTVAADEPARPDGLVAPVCVPELRDDRVAFVHEGSQLYRALDRAAAPEEFGGEDSLGRRLRDREHARAVLVVGDVELRDHLAFAVDRDALERDPGRD